uniref:Uncharacterized protein n=1 Tax=Tanacetum cinerariifolium TaxID=118510 RepID=A0A699U9S6_TANCI|nr:hypothetical protein [Tanacetum cinerariifolium]
MSTSMVAIICRLSSHLVSRRTTRAFVLGLLRASVEDARPSGSYFFDSLSNCSLKILLGSSKTCIFPSDLFTRSLPLMEKLSSLLAKLDIESSRSAG